MKNFQRADIKIVIEHLEEKLSKWLLIEYKHSYNIAGERLLITGIKIEGIPSTEKRFNQIFNPSRIIILDPQAPEELKPEDLIDIEALIIGGILGDHPPKGRTKSLLSDKFPEAKKRNIGDKQFPIDGAVYVANEVINGKRLKEIPYVYGLSIITKFKGAEREIVLPYAYPIINGRPLISEELIKYLIKSEEYKINVNILSS